MFSVFIYHYYANSIFARVQQERRVSVMQTASSVDLRLLAVENMARNLSYRTSLSKLLSGEDLAAHPIWHRKKFEESCSAMAHTLLYQDLGMEGISIFTSNRAIREKGGFYQADRLAGLAFYQAFMADEASFAIRCLDERETADYYAATERERFSDRAAALSLYKIYSLDGGVVGVLAFEFPAEELFSPVRLAVDNGNQYAVLFPGGRYYGVDPQATMETVPRDMIYAPLEHFPLWVADADILKKSDYTKPAQYVFLLLLAGIAYTLLLFVFIAKRIVARLNADLNEVDRILQNDFRGRLKIRGHDEISAISVRYNILLDKVNGLVRDVIAKERKGRNAQLRALQCQIDPHFIYNTLNVFSACAENDRNYPLSDAISSFGHLLRYTLKDDCVYGTVASELANARALANIYSIRRTGKLNLVTECPDELKGCEIIKFLIQPIIENSILHGWKKDGADMLITIQVSREADALRLKISDNGVGMPPEVLQKVMQHITAGAPVEKPQPGASSFIGLRNVYERIKLYYGPQAAMDITSRPMLYTRVQLTIPCKKTV